MTNKNMGWMLGAASVGMLFLLISADISQMKDFNEVWTPYFVGNMIAHIGNVLMAFVGGKLIPTSPQDQRIDDNGKRG
jgi:hypothetical protein